MTSDRRDHGWRTSRTEVDVMHVYPTGDVIEHSLDDQGDCLCGPLAELHQDTPVGDVYLYRHHSLDGRELHGLADRRLQEGTDE